MSLGKKNSDFCGNSNERRSVDAVNSCLIKGRSSTQIMFGNWLSTVSSWKSVTVSEDGGRGRGEVGEELSFLCLRRSVSHLYVTYASHICNKQHPLEGTISLHCFLRAAIFLSSFPPSTPPFFANLSLAFLENHTCTPSVRTPYILCVWNKILEYSYFRIGVFGGAISWGTALQGGRSRVRFPVVALHFPLT